ncbi:uncharacterized protein LOC107488483 isoform X1 [Arachis duranensis]|uniref:Uncharacterized protein LOC107488483 isoform X1 n=1 Tax=Arachis duranensis TaxID=130453 RepID=A0A6P4D9X2_ARADU|nr:uncharacterized protein LOC107488483 isoform X1 [Arachis duranensis]XP_025699772.1 uncharacterized protein LOC112801316 isoform X1 [Arachis hypogaea]
MAASFAPFLISGGSHVKSPELWSTKKNSYGVGIHLGPKLVVQRKSNLVSRRNRTSSICAEYRDSSGGGGGDFLAGFILGGAIFGTLAYVFAPQIRRSLLNEDEYGFRKAKRPIYYDEGLEQRTRMTLNEKISQLNSAIDNVSSRLRGGNNVPAAKIESDPEVEANI